jgi:NAD(P)-dependent dehydrogenase (short-subunit alcohol dehydrogenase family)
MKKENWNSNNIPDQKGKVVIVTGSSSGIGFETAKVLADKNAEVIIAVRNIEKGNSAKSKILNENETANVSVMQIDLSDLSSVQSFVNEFKTNFLRLDLLINNAGVMVPPYSKTKDGFELQMGTNHFGHFALTLGLIELLDQTKDSRIVNVSSMAHKYGNINFDDLNWEKRKYKAMRAYGDSKIANLYFTFELQKRLGKMGSKIKVTAAHPGWTATDLQRHSGLFSFLNQFFAMEGWQGALPTLRAAIDPIANGGDYFGPDGFQEWKGFPVQVGSNDLSKDTKIALKLWEVSEELTKQKLNLKEAMV